MACYTCSRCPENLNGCSFKHCEECGAPLCPQKDEVCHYNDGYTNHILCEDCMIKHETETEN